MCGLILFQFLMGTYLLEMNRQCSDWHIPLNCEEVVFGLTHNYWLWTCFVHPFFSYICIFHPFYPFMCCFFHPFLFFIFGHVAKYSFSSCHILRHVLIKYSYNNYILSTCSCSCSHTHQITIPRNWDPT
jgi:hypothetical protein